MNKQFIHSQDTIINQLHLYNGIGYKQDKSRHKRREKSKRVHFDFTLQAFV